MRAFTHLHLNFMTIYFIYFIYSFFAMATVIYVLSEWFDVIEIGK